MIAKMKRREFITLLGGAGDECRWDFEAKHLSGLDVNGQLAARTIRLGRR
jgi:hypothetical protein